MKNRDKIYWVAQLIGWGLFVAGNWMVYALKAPVYFDLVALWILVFVCGVGYSHAMRLAIKQLGWNNISVAGLIPRILPAAALGGLALNLTIGGMSDLFLSGNDKILDLSKSGFYISSVNFAIIFLLWLMLYFSFHFFENQREAGIKNLRLHVAQTEIELNSLRNQINPHFLFNSLNSIRALVDENPAKAKEAVTLLSVILRATLYAGSREAHVMSEEAQLVDKYILLEKIRFEERLLFQSQVHGACLDSTVPPLLILTMVENAVKHGISTLKSGGLIGLSINPSDRPGMMTIEVTNSGKLNPNSGSKGIGLQNTAKRLELLYGSKSSFEIKQAGDYVIATIEIPISNLA